jgi:hypothetical protein
MSADDAAATTAGQITAADDVHLRQSFHQFQHVLSVSTSHALAEEEDARLSGMSAGQQQAVPLLPSVP